VRLAEGDLTSEVRGEVGVEDKVLVIRRIRVLYRLKIPAAQRDAAQKVHGFHAGFCPVARTLSGCVEIATELDFEES
jgi:organic hydroperoxide reductase OsmC/OhrA